MICQVLDVIIQPTNLDMVHRLKKVNELPPDKTNTMICAPIEDSDQPGHPSSLVRVFAVRLKKAWILSYPLSAQLKSRKCHNHGSQPTSATEKSRQKDSTQDKHKITEETD